MESITLKEFNKFAAIHDLELVVAHGYFFWWVLTPDTNINHHEVYKSQIHEFSDLSLDEWIQHLKDQINKINKLK